MTRDHLMRRDDPVLCQTCGEPVTVLLQKPRGYQNKHRHFEQPDILILLPIL